MVSGFAGLVAALVAPALAAAQSNDLPSKEQAPLVVF
jgi:hypothetical protein